MANKYISDLTAATTLAGTDEFELDNGTNSRKITATNAAKSLQTLGFRGAMVKKASDQTAQNYSTGVNMTFDSEAYDTDGFHDNVTNNTRLTVTSGINYIEVGGKVEFANVTAGAEYQIAVLKNGTSSFDGATGNAMEMPSANLSAAVSCASGPIAVTVGDYFELFVRLSTDTSVDITAARTNFWIKAVG